MLKASEDELLVCLNLVRTRKDASVRRGAVVKALAICSQYRFVHAFRKVMGTTLDAIFVADSNKRCLRCSEATAF